MTKALARGGVKRSLRELLRARKNAASAKQAAHAAQADLETLRRHRNRARRVEREATAQADLAFGDYVAEDCRELCTSMHKTLPREVRDMVYRYLYEQATVEVVEDFFRQKSPPLEHSVPSHLWDPRSVGEEVHRELCEHFYRYNVFDFHDNFNMLPGFRVSDPWNIGHKPAELVTNVSVDVLANMYDLTIERKSGPHYRRHTDCDDAWGMTSGKSGRCNQAIDGRKSGAELLAELDMLFGFAAGTRVRLNIVPSEGSWWGMVRILDQEDALNLFLPLVSQVCTRLQAFHIVVCVVVKGGDNRDAAQDFFLGEAMDIESAKTAFEQHKEATENRLQEQALDTDGSSSGDKSSDQDDDGDAGEGDHG